MGHRVKFSDREKDWFRKKQLSKRKYRTRSERSRILIVCEGAKTEPNYFKSIKSMLPCHLAHVIDIEGEGANTQSLVNRARRIRDAKASGDYSYDEVWVVFDRDSFPDHDFDNAIHSAEAAGMKAVWSNEAFELWYILHFEARQTGMNRNEYKKCLDKHLDETYKKNDPSMYKKLAAKGSEAQAIQRAKRLQEDHQDITPHNANPCTKVNILVERLNEFRCDRNIQESSLIDQRMIYE